MSWTRKTVWWFVCVWIASALYVGPFVNKGWIPHDEGQLAQSASRILAGELPHRDFDEVYTGGLSYLHAWVFRLAGVRLVSMRWALLAFFLAWVPAVFWIAHRLARVEAAALVTFLAVVWSLPNYFASLPSWYNLFFATFGVAALMQHARTGGRRWLFAAGVAGGLSFLVKSAALYYVAGAILFLWTRELIESSATSDGRRHRAFLIGKAIAAVVLIAAVGMLVRSRPDVPTLTHFLLPVASVCILSTWVEAAWGHRAGGRRIRRMVSLLAPFFIGVAIPVGIFLFPYLGSRSLGDLWHGVFVMPQRRLTAAVFGLPPWFMLLPVVPYTAVLLAPSLGGRWQISSRAVIGSLAFVAAMLATSAELWSYQLWWNLARHLNVAAVVAGVVLLYRQLGSTWPPSEKQQYLWLLVGVIACFSLIEFPFTAPIYFCYTAPLVALALLAVVTTSQPPTSKSLHVAVAAALLIFAGARLNPGYITGLGFEYLNVKFVPAKLQRAGLQIPEGDRAVYQNVLGLIAAHAKGRFLYAAPDCPEVYFLSGLNNPTRTLYEVFDREPMTPHRLLDLVDRQGISVVVINLEPHFSGPLNPEIARALAVRFPDSATAGRFVVRWRT